MNTQSTAPLKALILKKHEMLQIYVIHDKLVWNKIVLG